MRQKVSSLYISPWSLEDPLCQSQSLAYIDQLLAEKHSFALLTFESCRFALKGKEFLLKQKALREKDIHWYPVKWQSGNSIISKILSVFLVFFTGIKICLKHRPELIHSRSSLPTFLAVSLSKLFRIQYLYDADSILSEEYAETGNLSRQSFGFKLLAWSESQARRGAKHIVVLAESLKQDFQQNYDVKIPIEVIPCCVDTMQFKRKNEVRAKRRQELGLRNELLFVYAGKIGTRYLVKDTFFFFKIYKQFFKNARLLIVSMEKPEAFRQIARSQGLSDDDFFIRQAKNIEVSEWLSASDIGLCLIRQMTSERGSSPIKYSEYLAAGLPVVITSKIGDCSQITKREKTGVVVDRLDSEKYCVEISKEVSVLLKDEELNNRCYKTAYKYFDLKAVGGTKYRKLYRELLYEK